MSEREQGQNTHGVPDVNPEADTASGGAPEKPDKPEDEEERTVDNPAI